MASSLPDRSLPDRSLPAKPAAEAAPDATAAPAAAAATPAGAADQTLALERQVADLRAELKRLKDQAEAAPFMPEISKDATYAGTEKVADDNGAEREVDMYHYRVDLPPSGGTDIKVNGRSFYHGAQYRVSRDTLATLMDIVARNWAHNAVIMGSNENAYRRPQERVINGGRR